MEDALKKIKIWYNQFIIVNNGSVSVYLIVILVPIFLFHAIMIDFVRVKLAEREAEMAVKTGVRSVLAGFDLELQPYGLFGLKEESKQAEEVFKFIIEQNISPSYPGGYLHLLDESLNKQDASVKSIYTLANQTVFQQQVLEEMKYSAPLQYTLELINKFKKPALPDQLHAVEQFSENAEKLETLLDQRNQALDDTWSEVARLLDAVESEVGDYDQSNISNMDNLKQQVSSVYSKFSDQYKSIIDHLNQAELKNTLLDNEKQRLTAAAGSSRTNQEIFQAIVIYDINYFSSYKAELGKVIAAFGGLSHQLEVDAAVINSTEFKFNWKLSNQALVKQMNSFRLDQGTKEAQRQGNYSKSTLKKNEQKNKMNQAVLAAKQSNQGCGALSGDVYNNIYQSLNGSSNSNQSGLYNKYRNYNKNSDELRQNEPYFKPDSGEQTNKSSILWIKQFTGMVTNFRDDLYLNEYALSKFNYRTSNLASPITNRQLKNQEVEYILYGFGSCSANYSAAYSEMFVMLMAIRTMEALLKPQNEVLNVGSPLLVYLAAAAQGATEAYEDMGKLLKGEAIPILKKTPNLRIDYKDLLRIFLMMHHNEERMISRMQALIELETGTELEKTTTYIQGTASISLRLWFLPKLMSSLHFIGVPKCKLTTANRCEIKKSAVMSY
jgi:hypothetical protein